MSLNKLGAILAEARLTVGDLYPLPDQENFLLNGKHRPVGEVIEGCTLVGVMLRLPGQVLQRVKNSAPALWPIHESVDGTSRYFFAKAEGRPVTHWWGIEPSGTFAWEGLHLILSSPEMMMHIESLIEAEFAVMSHHQLQLPGLAGWLRHMGRRDPRISIQFVSKANSSWVPEIIRLTIEKEVEESCEKP